MTVRSRRDCARTRLEFVEEFEDVGVEVQEAGVFAEALRVVVRDAFELAAGGGAVFVDGAAVVGVQELAAAVGVGEDAFGDGGSVEDDGDGGGEGAEAGVFVGLEEDGVFVAVLLAAVGAAGVAGALAEDGEAEFHRGEFRCKHGIIWAA